MDYICIYTKAPIPGQTKSRLARKIGTESAAKLAKAMLLDISNTIDRIDHVAAQIWYPPEHSPQDFAGLIPEKFTFHRQSGNNLGDRLSHTFSELISNHFDRRVVIVGSDCITHTVHSLKKALELLIRYPVVFQPSVDGGYVLIGQSKWNPEIFSEINWGKKEVYHQSLDHLKRLKLKYYSMPVSMDVDTVDDLRRILPWIDKEEKPHTYSWLSENNWIKSC